MSAPSDFIAWLKQQPGSQGRHLGLDIGGANLKACLWQASTLNGTESWSLPFPLWKHPEKLTEALKPWATQLAVHDRCWVTMTGEIADCFADKRQGVAAIVHSVCHAFDHLNAPPSFYGLQPSNSGLANFLSAEDAIGQYLSVAASNWHAVAQQLRPWLLEQHDGDGLLLDLGSTTFDLTPIHRDRSPCGQTDFQRLCNGQLLYTGVGRSPLACLVPSCLLPESQIRIPLAQELFATARDAYLLTGDLPEAPEDRNTADGRPATAADAAQRIARMFCSDRDELPADLTLQVALAAKAHQMSTLTSAIQRQRDTIPKLQWIAFCGQGEALLAQVLAQSFPSLCPMPLSQHLGSGTSELAPAFAVAALGYQSLA